MIPEIVAVFHKRCAHLKKVNMDGLILQKPSDLGSDGFCNKLKAI